MDVLVRDMASGEVQRLMAGDAFYNPLYWSPDGQYLTVFEFISGTNSNVYLLSPADGTHRLLTPHEGEVQYNAGPWAADGSGFYMVTDEGREFAGLAFYDLAAGQLRWWRRPIGTWSSWRPPPMAASWPGR